MQDNDHGSSEDAIMYMWKIVTRSCSDDVQSHIDNGRVCDAILNLAGRFDAALNGNCIFISSLSKENPLNTVQIQPATPSWYRYQHTSWWSESQCRCAAADLAGVTIAAGLRI